jgi:hypothetical protein
LALTYLVSPIVENWPVCLAGACKALSVTVVTLVRFIVNWEMERDC